MPRTRPILHMLCGKIASGKSTLAARLSAEEGTVLIAEDPWLHALYDGQMSTLADYVQCSARLRAAMGPHVVALLENGVSVVLDFPANTVETRRWMRDILARVAAEGRLHLMTADDDLCLTRLRERNARGDHPFAPSEEQFHQISAHFAPPTPDEGFTVVKHA